MLRSDWNEASNETRATTPGGGSDSGLSGRWVDFEKLSSRKQREIMEIVDKLTSHAAPAMKEAA